MFPAGCVAIVPFVIPTLAPLIVLLVIDDIMLDIIESVAVGIMAPSVPVMLVSVAVIIGSTVPALMSVGAAESAVIVSDGMPPAVSDEAVVSQGMETP